MAEHRDRRAQPTQRDPHLMDALRVAPVQGGGLVGAPVLQAGAQDRADRPVDRGAGAEGERRGLVHGRRLAPGERVAARGLAPGLEPQRAQLVELQRQVVERRGRAVEQLELDLGDRLRAAVGLDRAEVERGLDQARPTVAVGDLEPAAGASHPGGEQRTQAVDGSETVQGLGGAGRQEPQVGLGRGQRRLPLAATGDHAARIVGLQRLDVAAAILAHPERQASGPQTLVRGVVVDVLQASGAAPAGRPGADRRVGEQRLQDLRITAELELDFRIGRRIGARAARRSVFGGHGVASIA